MKRIAISARRNGTGSRLNLVIEVTSQMSDKGVESTIKSYLGHNYPGWELAYWADMGIPL